MLAHQRRRIKDFYIVFCKKQKQELGKASDFWVHNGSQPVTRAEPEREHSREQELEQEEQEEEEQEPEQGREEAQEEAQEQGQTSQEVRRKNQHSN